MSCADRVVGALEQHVLDEVRDAASASDSWREPRVSQTPTVTERTCGIASVTSRKPDGSVSRRSSLGRHSLRSDPLTDSRERTHVS